LNAIPDRTYDFVPLGPGVPRAPARGHDRLDGEAGRLTCRLETLRPIFTPQNRPPREDRRAHETLRFARTGNQPMLPGSSLKGVVRSVVEAVFDGCLVLFDERYRTRKFFPGGRRPGDSEAYIRAHPASRIDDHGNYLNVFTDHRVRLPQTFRRCQSNQALCIACRLFGTLQHGNVYLGNVSLSDAIAEEFQPLGTTTLAVLDTPKPRDEERYLTPDGARIAGRKFYFHSQAPVPTGPRSGLTSTIEPLVGRFTFTVDYANLRPVELDALLYGLFLEPDLAHKVGMGKPLGLGSVRIRPLSLLRHPPDAYLRLSAPLETLTGDAFSAWIAERYATLSDSPQRAALRRIWAWPQSIPARLTL
jgi:hypothetical protein